MPEGAVNFAAGGPGQPWKRPGQALRPHRRPAKLPVGTVVLQALGTLARRRSGVGWTSRICRFGWRGPECGSEGLSVTGTTQSSSDDPAGNEPFRLKIEGFGVGTWDLDLSTRELDWSDAARNLFGVAAGHAGHLCIVPLAARTEDREHTEQAIERVTESGGNLDVSFRIGGHGRRRSTGSASAAAWSGTGPGSPPSQRAGTSISTQRSNSKRR